MKKTSPKAEEAAFASKRRGVGVYKRLGPRLITVKSEKADLSMSEKTQNQTKREEEQARERVELVDFQYGVGDLVSRLGTTLSSLVVFGGVLYIAGGLYAWSYFSGFGAEWLLCELSANFFPFSVLLQVIDPYCLCSWEHPLKCTKNRKGNICGRGWWNLNSQHEPHKEYMLSSSLFNLSFFLSIPDPYTF